MARIAVFAALTWECRPVLRALRGLQSSQSGEFVSWEGRAGDTTVSVVRTGVGRARAATAIAAVDLSAITMLVSTGCAGGLDPSLGPGDLVIANEIIAGETHWSIDGSARERAAEIATAARLRVSQSPVRCCENLLVSTQDKAQAAAGGAVAAEMEGGPLAAAAARAGIPFLSIRAVLDGADVDLEVLKHFSDPLTGTVRPLALLRRLGRHPGEIAKLLAMRRAQVAAEQSLTRFFSGWFGDNT